MLFEERAARLRDALFRRWHQQAAYMKREQKRDIPPLQASALKLPQASLHAGWPPLKYCQAAHDAGAVIGYFAIYI